MKRILPILCLGAILALSASCSKEAKQARYLRSAEKYFADGQYQKAEVQYLNAMRLDPQNAPVTLRLGQICFEEGRFERAFGFLGRARELGSDDAQLHFMLGVLYYSAGELANARTQLRAALIKDANHPEALGLLAETALAPGERKALRDEIQASPQGQADKPQFHVALGVLALREQDSKTAEAEFKQAVALDSKFIPAHLSLGMLSWQKNDLTNAEVELKTAADLSPLRSTRRVKLTEFKMKTGAVAEAKKLLEAMVQATPDFLLAWRQLAELQLNTKELDACLASVNRIRSIEPADYEAGILGARVRMAQGKVADSLKEFEAVRTRHPKQAGVHYQLALAYLVNREPIKAMASLQQCLILNTNLYEPVLLLADLKTRQGDAAGAITLLTNLIKQRPNDEQAYHLLATAYNVRGTPDQAVAVYRALFKAYPRNANAPYSMGLVLAQQKKYAEARKAFETALEVAPDLSAALLQLVEVDLLEKNVDLAFARVQAAMQKDPKAANLQVLLAKIYLAQGDSANAEAALRKCLELAPNSQEAYFALAQILVAAKKPDLAMQELGKALARNPKDTSALMMMGILQEAKNDYPKAREFYEKVLEINPQHSVVLNNLAYLYAVRFKQPDKGFEFAQRARRLLPDSPAAADTVGWITYLGGDYAGALLLLQESAAKLVNEPEVQYHLGMAHYMMGNEAPARLALERAVASDKEYVGKEEASQKLASLKAELPTSPSARIAALEKALAQSPNDTILLTRLGAAYEASGQPEKTPEIAERILKANPKAVEAMLMLVRVYGARPDGAQRALDYAKAARAAAPGDDAVAHAAGRAAFEAGQHEWAYSILQESGRDNREDSELLYDLAWSAYAVGRVAEAETAMSSALRAGTNFSRLDPARRFLEILPFTRTPATTAEATAKLEAALKADPNYLPGLMAAAVAWEQRGNYVEAQKRYEQILGRYRLFIPATRNLALLDINHLGEAQKGYELGLKARQALPEDTELAHALGKLSYTRGEYQYAVQLLREVQQKKAASAETYYFLGMSQYRLKQTTDSATSLRQALAMNLEAKLGDEARKVLAQVTKP